MISFTENAAHFESFVSFVRIVCMLHATCIVRAVWHTTKLCNSPPLFRSAIRTMSTALPKKKKRCANEQQTKLVLNCSYCANCFFDTRIKHTFLLGAPATTTTTPTILPANKSGIYIEIQLHWIMAHLSTSVILRLCGAPAIKINHLLAVVSLCCLVSGSIDKICLPSVRRMAECRFCQFWFAENEMHNCSSWGWRQL